MEAKINIDDTKNCLISIKWKSTGEIYYISPELLKCVIDKAFTNKVQL